MWPGVRDGSLAIPPMAPACSGASLAWSSGGSVAAREIVRSGRWRRSSGSRGPDAKGPAKSGSVDRAPDFPFPFALAPGELFCMAAAFHIRPVLPEDADAWVRLRTALWPHGAADHPGEIAAFFAGTAAEPL